MTKCVRCGQTFEGKGCTHCIKLMIKKLKREIEEAERILAALQKDV